MNVINYMSLDLDERLRNLLNQRIVDEIDYISINIALAGGIIFGTDCKALYNYIFSNQELLPKISDNTLSRLLQYNYMDRKEVVAEIERRVKNGSTLLDFSPIISQGLFGMSINSTLIAINKLPQDIITKIVENCKAKIKKTFPSIESWKQTSFQSSLALARIVEQGNFKKDGQRIMLELMNETSESYKDFNYSLLNQSIIDDFGETFIKEIGVYPELSSKIIFLHDNCPNLYNVYVSIINNLQSDDSLEVLYKSNSIILNFLFTNYKFLSEINNNNVNIESLYEYIMQMNLTLNDIDTVNYTSSFTQEMFNNYDKTFDETYDKYIRKPSKKLIDRVKEIYFLKYFSITKKDAEQFVSRYKIGIEEIIDFASDEDGIKLNTVISLIEEIIETDDIQLLKALYDYQEFRVTYEEILKLNEIARKKYAQTYVKAFERTKKSIENSTNVNYVSHDGKKVKIVEIDDDFAMLVHSNNTGYVVEKEEIVDSYVDSWTAIDYLKTPGLSTSYIDQNNIGTAPVKNGGVLYGFLDIKNTDIFSLSPYDLNSHIANYGFKTGNEQIYVTAEQMSYYTTRAYNEFVISRAKNIPSCVVLYEDASPDEIQSTIQAAAEWNIPVVRINRLELTRKQVAKINEFTSLFEQTSDYTYLKSAIELSESYGTGLRLNKIEGTGNYEYSPISSVTLNTFDVDRLKETIANEIKLLAERRDVGHARQLLAILKSIENRYTVTNSINASIIKTKSILGIENYIEQLEILANGGSYE